MAARRLLVVCLAAVAAWLVPTTAAAAQLGLSWTDLSADEDGFLVERRVASSPAFQQVALLGPGAAGFLDTTVAAGQAYCYRVRAFNAAGASAHTNEACGTAGGTAALPLRVALDQASYTRSQVMVATVTATAGLVATPIDAYVVVQTGAGLLSLQLDGRLVPGLVPIARNVVLPTVAVPFAFPLAGAPPGTYTWLAGVTVPGSLTLVAPIASTPFAITP